MVRVLVRIALVVAVLLAAFLFLGPLAPDGSVIERLSRELGNVFRAWLGIPFG